MWVGSVTLLQDDTGSLIPALTRSCPVMPHLYNIVSLLRQTTWLMLGHVSVVHLDCLRENTILPDSTPGRGSFDQALKNP